MNTNIKIALTDEQRRQLQVQLTGKQRLISRAELTQFVTGVVTGAMDCEEVTEEAVTRVPCFSPRSDLTEMPAKWAAKYADRPEHWQVGWLKGWNLVGASLEK
jgi:hypothetical protein